MSLPRLRTSGLLLCLLSACLGIWGCPDGQSSFIPPQPTAPPSGSNIYVYSAEATNPDVGTLGGAVSAYRVGADGFLEGDPISTVEVVNPRRLAVHPDLNVLYVATLNQVIAFDISTGFLVSMCGDGGAGLAPPCATNPSLGSDPTDIAVARNADGSHTLYLAEGGGSTPVNVLSRIAAFPLGPNGELPGFPTSQGRAFDTASYFSVATSPLFVWAADAPIQRINRFPREDDGSLPYEAPTPTPINQQSPTPSPTPTPGPTVTPTPSPVLYLVNFPGRIAISGIPGAPAPTPQTFFAVEQGANRIGSWVLDSFENLPFSPTAETGLVGFYNAILLSPDASHLYAAAFQVGRIDDWLIDATTGNLVASSQNSTFENAAAYPTGLAWLTFTNSSGQTQNVLYGSFGGLARIDGYQVLENGALDSRPFTSTTPRDSTFPADVAVKVLPVP
ncbi:MAG: hypothetical protein FJ144_10970 [Deltaproteobacteria bacterium]|nr:hypothetical protein [Deltaproteobacteria bacterium]